MSNRVTKMFGPPGTGKTTELLNLLEQVMADGTPPERVAYLTFTTKASREAVERTRARFGFEQSQMPFFRTLHSIAYRQLEVGGSTMIRGNELTEFSELVGLDLTGMSRQTESGLAMTRGHKHGDLFMTFDHLRRHRGQTVEEAHREWREDFSLKEVNYFVETYAAWKHQEGLLDFTDLLTEITAPLPVDVVFVDEAQDLSWLQWMALTKLAKNAKAIYIAGDDDQAIFRWAGANPDVLLRLKGKARVLGQSYRIPRAVHDLAGKMVSRIKERQPKEWKPRDEEGRAQWMTDAEHVDWGREGTYLVLFRNHYLRDRVEPTVHSAGLPYSHTEKATPGAEWGRAIIMWERLRKGASLPTADVAAVYDAMVTGQQLTRSARAQLERCAREEVDIKYARAHLGLQAPDAPWFEALGKVPLEELSYMRKVIKNHGSAALTATPPIHMTTIHAVKGGEADHVVLLTDASRRVKEEIQHRPDDERRVYYVGLTRARQSLQIIDSFNNPLFNTL